MFRDFLRSTGAIALLLVLGICTTPAIWLMAAPTSTTVDGVETSSGMDLGPALLGGTTTAIGACALVAAGFLTVRRVRRRRG